MPNPYETLTPIERDTRLNRSERAGYALVRYVACALITAFCVPVWFFACSQLCGWTNNAAISIQFATVILLAAPCGLLNPITFSPAVVLLLRSDRSRASAIGVNATLLVLFFGVEAATPSVSVWMGITPDWRLMLSNLAGLLGPPVIVGSIVYSWLSVGRGPRVASAVALGRPVGRK